MNTGDKKKVVVLRDDLLWNSETFILEQAKRLREWEVILVGKNKIKDGIDLSNINYKIIPKVRSNMTQRWLTKFKAMLWIKNKEIENFIKSLNPDVIHIHFGTDAVTYWKSIKDLDTPIFITLHGFDINTYKEWWQSGKGGYFMKNYPDRLLKISKHSQVSFIAVSNAIKQRAIDYGIQDDKITVHYTGIDTEIFKPSSKPISLRDDIILFIGRFVENKGVMDIILAFEKILIKNNKAKLVLIGDGYLKYEIEKLVRERNIPCEFTGTLHTTDIINWLKVCKVLCLPSKKIINGESEGLGQVLLEAQAAGIPVVGSNVGGIKEAMLENVTGVLFESGNIIDLSEKIIFLLKNPDINRFSSNARKHILNMFDLDKQTTKLEEIYNERKRIL